MPSNVLCWLFLSTSSEDLSLPSDYNCVVLLMRCECYSTWSVCLSMNILTLQRYEVAYERYQQL